MTFAPVFQRPYSATFDRRTAAVAGNGLLNALIAYWPGNEASGNLLDLHTNALHLTDNNTVTTAAGKVYATARQYTAANSEDHRIADNALLSAGDVDMTLAAWVWADTVINNAGVLGKWTQPEYAIIYLGSRISFYVRKPDSSASGAVLSNALGIPSASTWYFILAWHDSVADTISIQINNGTIDSQTWTFGIRDSTAQFMVGSYVGSGTYWNGRIGPVTMWKSAAGLGGVLTAAQRTALYNSGAGLSYTAFTT